MAIAVPAVLAVVPWALLLRAMWRDAVNVPLVDEWAFASEVVRRYDGVLTASDLWMQNNEHRVPVSKIILHVLAALTHWDLRWGIACNAVVATATVVVVAWLLARTIRPAVAPATGILLLLAVAVQCSLVQWQNWTWGWQLGLFLSEAAGPAVAAAVLLAATRGRSPAVWSAVAVLIAVLGAFCHGGGLLLLFLVPVALVACRVAGAAIPLRIPAAAAAAAVCVVLAYRYGWYPAFGQPPPTPVVGHVVVLSNYAFRFLGGPIAATEPSLAWTWGLAALITAPLAMILAWVASPARRVAVIPWAMLAAYSIGSAMLVAIGRYGAGEHTALLSRYTTYSVPLWLATPPLTVLAIAALRPRALRLALYGIAALAAGLAVRHGYASWAWGDFRMASRAEVARRAVHCIREPENAPDACYLTVCWDANVARTAAVALRDRRLGPWATAHDGADGPP